MATLTSNISNVSITVSGNTTKSATISWSLPSVPSGSTVTACTLTGKATASMSKGSATIKVNGTTVSSGSNFTINLGTNNTTSSVTATAVGGNKNASGTVTLSNLVYTVTYTEPAVTYTVTFKDWDGTILKTEEVGSGSSATAPSNPSRDGYRFTGWNPSYSNITSDLTVTALYIQVYTVTFLDYDGTVLKTQTVDRNTDATAPEVNREGYTFIGWSVDFTKVTSDITTIAQYDRSDVLKIKENGNWNNIGKVYKRISGNWVEQSNDSLKTLFNTNTKYKIGKPNPVAILYSDGTMVFQDSDVVDSSHGDVVGTYIGWDIDEYNGTSQLPWYSSRASINNININTIISPKYTNFWFYNCSGLTSLDLSNFDTSNVIGMGRMFSICSRLTSIDLSNFDTSNVTSMNSIFSGCSGLTSIDLSNFDTSNVINMSYMFSSCSGLTSIDLSNFDTSNVTNMSRMFNGCSGLTSLDLSNFDMSKVTLTTSMFEGCTSLTTIYVKDETSKTKIESSDNFPTTATVIIGKPN